MPHIRPAETVASALRASDAGMRDADNAALHGVAVKTIRRWRRLYQRRGLPRGQGHTVAPCPRSGDGTLDEPAYAELLGWYLGEGHTAEGRRDVYNLHVYNDQKYVEDNTRLQRLMALVKPGGRPHTRLVPGAVITTCSWKHWPCLFPQHGPGRQDQRRIGSSPGSANWSSGTRVPSFAASSTRTGAARGPGRRRSSPAGSNATTIPLAVHQPLSRHPWTVCWALDLVDIPWRQSNAVTISVSTRAGVARLDDLICLKA